MKNAISISNHPGAACRCSLQGMAQTVIFKAGLECIKMVGGVVFAALITLIVGL
jgi:hypothetical protein